MIGVLFDPAKLESEEQRAWWDKWQTRADAATKKAIGSFEVWLSGSREKPLKLEFDTEIWKDLKNWLMKNVFYGKCGYCESPIGRFWGDAEHYRPKGAIKFMRDGGEIVRASCHTLHPKSNDPLEFIHPGYFWLAYDWRNLVPACQFCNSGPGKNERFDTQHDHLLMVKLGDNVDVSQMRAEEQPIASEQWPGYYYYSPAMLDKSEGPLLLFPLNPAPDQNPSKHLRFGIKGTIAPVKGSSLGKVTIEVLGLREENLRQARQGAQEDFNRQFAHALGEDDPETARLKAREVLDKYVTGTKPFSSAILGFHKDVYGNLPTVPAGLQEETE